VSDKDLPAVYNLSQRNRFVSLPFGNGLSALNEDDEVVILALVVDLRLCSVSADHVV